VPGVELGKFDCLNRNGARTAGDIANGNRALASLSLLTETTGCRFSLTGRSAALRTDAPGSLRYTAMPSQRVGISEPSPVRIPLSTRKKNHFFERKSDSYPLCGRWSEGQASKRNKWREARREAPFMPDCDLDRSGTFCLLNPPTDQHKKQTLSTAGLSSLVAQKHNDCLASIRSSSDYDPRLSRGRLWRLLFRSTLLELYFSRVWAFQKAPIGSIKIIDTYSSTSH
jgi:hypothetical protein